MKRLLLAVSLACGFALPFAAAEPTMAPIAGYDRLEIDAPHRARPLDASLWYPAGRRTYRGLIGDNAVFKGTSGLVGAAIAEGRFPLVVLSHGSGGNMDAIAWISSGLALRGAMVLAVNHPGSTSGDSSPRRSLRLDERAADLTSALDHLLAAPEFARHVDAAHITSLGFSLGGTTALGLAGARWDREAYRAYCARMGELAEDCVFFARGGVDFAALPEGFAADMRDPRISAAIAVDPGMSHAITEASADTLSMPVLLISLGEKHLWKAADVGPSGSNLAGRLANARRVVVKPAHHFTFLAECKPEGAAVLAAEEDDPVCNDPEGTDRARVHAEIIDRSAEFMGL